MVCADATPTDGFGWADVADCLARNDLPHAALVAWEHAIDADPTLGRGAVASVQDLAHRTGDDRLLVSLAPERPYDPDSIWVTDPDLAGHLAYAQATPGSPGEHDLLASISGRSCRYPYAQYRLARMLHGEQPKSEVMALRQVLVAPEPEDNVPAVALQHMKDAALLQIATVYATLERPENAENYARMLPLGLPTEPYLRYVQGWARFANGDETAAEAVLRRVARVLPEANALLIAIQPDEDQRRTETEKAFHHWNEVRTELVAFVDRWEDDPAGAAHAKLDHVAPYAAYAAGGMAPVATTYARAYSLQVEARHARLDPVARGLLAEARADNEEQRGLAVLDLATRGIARIDAALADPATQPHHWTWDDFGW